MVVTPFGRCGAPGGAATLLRRTQRGYENPQGPGGAREGWRADGLGAHPSELEDRQMEITKPTLAADVVALRSSRVPPDRALGDNISTEERVTGQQRDAFQSVTTRTRIIREALGTYFLARVQGIRRGHIPDTFTPLNREAVWDADVDPNQLIVRVERIDDASNKTGLRFRGFGKKVRPTFL